jgi:hypothetical protein
LTARDPDNAEWRRDEWLAHNLAGRILEGEGKQGEAQAEYEKAKKLAP